MICVLSEFSIKSSGANYAALEPLSLSVCLSLTCPLPDHLDNERARRRRADRLRNANREPKEEEQARSDCFCSELWLAAAAIRPTIKVSAGHSQPLTADWQTRRLRCRRERKKLMGNLRQVSGARDQWSAAGASAYQLASAAPGRATVESGSEQSRNKSSSLLVGVEQVSEEECSASSERMLNEQ